LSFELFDKDKEDEGMTDVELQKVNNNGNAIEGQTGLDIDTANAVAAYNENKNVLKNIRSMLSTYHFERCGEKVAGFNAKDIR